jgi:hypothetical protein
MRRLVNLLLVFAFLAPVGAAAQPPGFGFEELERSLRLTPYQREQFDAATRATQRAMIAIGLGMIQVKSRLAQELLKDRPDPDALMMAQQELVDFSRPHVRNAREEWMRLYAMLDEDQVRFARGFVEEKLRLLEKVAEQLGRSLAEKLK